MPNPSIKMTHIPTGESQVATSGEVLRVWARKAHIQLPSGCTARGVRKLKNLPYGKVYMTGQGNLSLEEIPKSVFVFEIFRP